MYNLVSSEADLFSAAVSARATSVSSSWLLTQTCGWPLVSGERDKWAAVVAAPRYDAPGCDAESAHYSSLIVVRVDSDCDDISSLRGKRMAINSWDSCSGHLLPAATIGPEVYASTAEATTGSHLESCRKVANGEADFAGVDCVTFEMIRLVLLAVGVS